MNTRIFHRLLGVILWLGIASPLLAQPKNILYLRFEQKHISRAIPIADDSVFSVYYRLVSPKPSNFHGIQIDFSYDKTILAPIDKGVLVAGSAAANATAFSGVNAQKGTNNIAILGDQMFDTSNRLLFRYRATVFTKAAIDSAAISIFLIDLGFNSGIDSVVVENAGGKDEAGYYPFAVAYLDSVKEVVHQKHQLTIHSDSVFIHSDSVKTLSISIDSASVVNIQTAVFSAHFDSSVLEILSIDKGPILANSTAVSDTKADSFSFAFTSERVSTAGDLIYLTVKAKHRNDTVETRLINPKLTVSNTDDSISTIIYDLRPIIVQGIKDSVVDTTHSAVAIKNSTPEWISIKGRHLTIASTEQPFNYIRVYSITGALIAQLPVTTGETVIPQSIPSGPYLFRGEATGDVSKERTFFCIIH